MQGTHHKHGRVHSRDRWGHDVCFAAGFNKNCVFFIHQQPTIEDYEYIQVRFTATRGRGSRSTVGIDDIEFGLVNSVRIPLISTPFIDFRFALSKAFLSLPFSIIPLYLYDIIPLYDLCVASLLFSGTFFSRSGCGATDSEICDGRVTPLVGSSSGNGKLHHQFYCPYSLIFASR